jgi:hypothetical protein
VTRRGPCAVQREPDSSGLNAGLHRRHPWNSGMAVSAAMLACQAAAKLSTEAATRRLRRGCDGGEPAVQHGLGHSDSE